MSPQFDPSTVQGWIRFLAIPVFFSWALFWKPNRSRQMFAIRLLASWTIHAGLIVETYSPGAEPRLGWVLGTVALLCCGAYWTVRAFGLLNVGSDPPNSINSDI